jgi:hypothetical protein
MTVSDPLCAPTTTKETGTPPAEGISVLVAVSERPSPLDELYREFSAPLRDSGVPFEFLFMVESFNSHLTEHLKALQANGEPIRVAQCISRWARQGCSGPVWNWLTMISCSPCRPIRESRRL